MKRKECRGAILRYCGIYIFMMRPYVGPKKRAEVIRFHWSPGTSEDPGVLCIETAAFLSKLFYAVIRVILSRVCIDVPRFSDVAIQPIYSIPSAYHNDLPGAPMTISSTSWNADRSRRTGAISRLLFRRSSRSARNSIGKLLRNC